MKHDAIVFALALLVLAGCVTQDQKADRAFDRGDYQAALTGYQALAAQHDARAEMQLAYMYANGKGVPKDPAQTQQWYERAALDGSDVAARWLGDAYQYQAVPPDYADAFKWYQVGAGRYDQYCMLQLSVLYENGLGVARDEAAAQGWLNHFAGQTNVVGQKVYYMFTGGDNTGGFIMAVESLFSRAVRNTPGMAGLHADTVTLSFHMQDGRASDVEVSRSSGDPHADAAAAALLQQIYLPPVLASLAKVDRFTMTLNLSTPGPDFLYGSGPG